MSKYVGTAISNKKDIMYIVFAKFTALGIEGDKVPPLSVLLEVFDMIYNDCSDASSPEMVEAYVNKLIVLDSGGNLVFNM